MDCHHYTTELPECEQEQYLQREERGTIQALKQQGLANRAIARVLGCSPQLEMNCGVVPRPVSQTKGVPRATICFVRAGTERTSQWIVPSFCSQGGIHGE